MRSKPTAVLVAATIAAALCAGSTSAAAKCTKLGFSVNDYGKDGPTKDAKSLLDKYIADWAKTHGVTKYTVGKKDVSCELFLDFIVFDEHTCKATAVVCWPDGSGPAVVPGAPPAPKKAPAAKPAAVKKAG